MTMLEVLSENRDLQVQVEEAEQKSMSNVCRLSPSALNVARKKVRKRVRKKARHR